MTYTSINLRQEGGNGTGYTGEVTDVSDYVDVPNDSFFKHRDYLPDTDLVLYKDISGVVQNPYSGGLSVITYIAGENIGGQKVVMINTGKAFLFDPTNDNNIGKQIGISNQASITNDPIDVISSGLIVSSGWGLVPDAIYYAGINGTITTTEPTGVFVFQRIGVAIDSNTLKLEFSEPISII